VVRPLLKCHGNPTKSPVGARILRTVQDYLGHRDPKHTAHYTRCRAPVRGAVAVALPSRVLARTDYATSAEFGYAIGDQ